MMIANIITAFIYVFGLGVSVGVLAMLYVYFRLIGGEI